MVEGLWWVVRSCDVVSQQAIRRPTRSRPSSMTWPDCLQDQTMTVRHGPVNVVAEQRIVCCVYYINRRSFTARCLKNLCGEGHLALGGLHVGRTHERVEITPHWKYCPTSSGRGK